MKEGWEIKKLGEVCGFQGGSQPPKSQFIYEPKEGYVRFLQIRDFASDKNITFIPESKKNRYCNSDDILLGRYGASVGKVLVNKAGAYNVAVMKTIPDETVLSKAFLFLYLSSDDFQNRLASVAARSAQNGFSKNDIFDFPLPLPPLPEQQRIVSILDEAFAAIDKAKANAEQNLINANELFENSAQEIFSQKGIDWEEKLLGDFAEFRNGINYTKGSKGEKIKIVGVKDFQESYWVPEIDLVEVSLDGKINDTDLLREGDILAVRSNGNPQLIGRTLLAGIINEKVSHSGFTIRIRLNSQLVNPNYLCHFMKIQQTRKTLVESGNGVGIRSLNQGSLSSLKIPFPKSLKKQEMIIDKVDSIAEQSQKLKDIYQRKINDLDELKKSILKKAFAGELTETKQYALHDENLSLAAEPNMNKSRRDETIIENKMKNHNPTPKG